MTQDAGCWIPDTGNWKLATGNCVDGSTATVVMPMCGPGNQPDTFYDACETGGLAAGACINGTTPGF